TVDSDGDGDPTIDNPQDPIDDGQWGGHGGHGDGNGYGGAIAILAGSTPTISNCQFIGNVARGGIGGNGGDGGWSPDALALNGAAGRGGQPGDAGSQGSVSGTPGFGGQGTLGIGADGFGGAIYCGSSGSNPTIIGCTFTNNVATEGLPGEVGAAGEEGGAFETDELIIGPPLRDGIVFIAETMVGGAIYAENDQLILDNCTFTENATGFVGGIGPVYTKGGAVYCGQNMDLGVINDSEFTKNAGGAIYCDTNCNVNIQNSIFSDNRRANSGL
ncbi:unnamed protein product, partial [marine sediment metagenome]